MVKEMKGLTSGISTTRRYQFARVWLNKTLTEPGVIIEFDQGKLQKLYLFEH